MNSRPASSESCAALTLLSHDRLPALGRLGHGQSAGTVRREQAELEPVRVVHPRRFAIHRPWRACEVRRPRAKRAAATHDISSSFGTGVRPVKRRRCKASRPTLLAKRMKCGFNFGHRRGGRPMKSLLAYAVAALMWAAVLVPLPAMAQEVRVGIASVVSDVVIFIARPEGLLPRRRADGYDHPVHLRRQHGRAARRRPARCRQRIGGGRLLQRGGARHQNADRGRQGVVAEGLSR